ncbi:hypothetical protein LBMAG42_45680 [Deltaproteobacteria bacterium]|nr:hypothetical protein LBMAG42_45680 [Deltaproteobacteria bacterium]
MTEPAPNFMEAFDLARGMQHGFSALKRCFPVLFVGGCLKGCTEGGGGGGGGDLGDSIESFQKGGSAGGPDVKELFSELGLGELGEIGIGVIVAAVFIVFAIVLVFRAWILPGWVRLHEEVLRTGEGQFGTLLGATDVFASSLAWGVIEGLMYIVWIALIAGPYFLLFVVPVEQHRLVGVIASAWGVGMLGAGIYLFLSTAFVNHVIAFEGLGVVDAVARSFDLAAGNRLWLALYTFLYWMVGVVMAVVGLCMCCIGTLVTQPVGIVIRDFGFTEGFLRFTRPADELAGWTIHQWGKP